MQVKWLRRALENMDAAYDYLVAVNPVAALGFADEVTKALEQLQAFPSSGRPGRVPGTRELVLTKYSFIIPYRVMGNELQILRVFSTQQQLPESWQV